MADPTGPPEPTPPALLEIGRITKPHGIRGEVIVHLLTDRVERLAPGAVVRGRAGRMLEIRTSVPFQDRHRVRFVGVDDRTAAEALAGTPLLAPPVEDPDALWVHDLIGARVVEVGGTDRGLVEAVQANPAHDLLVLDTGALVPIVFVVGLEAGVCTIDPPLGLFDDA